MKKTILALTVALLLAAGCGDVVHEEPCIGPLGDFMGMALMSEGDCDDAPDFLDIYTLYVHDVEEYDYLRVCGTQELDALTYIDYDGRTHDVTVLLHTSNDGYIGEITHDVSDSAGHVCSVTWTVNFEEVGL